MKRDPKLVIGGYNVPGGVSRVAVAAAVNMIRQHPGARQSEVQKFAVRFSGLNDSTAGWITTPGPKGPCGHLWNRQKEDVFRCYANEDTGLLNLDHVELAKDIAKRAFASIGHKPGELVEVETYRGKEVCMLVGFKLYGTYEFAQLHKGTDILKPFGDVSFLDNPKVWGAGIPTISCVVTSGNGVTDWPSARVRAIPATT